MFYNEWVLMTEFKIVKSLKRCLIDLWIAEFNIIFIFYHY